MLFWKGAVRAQEDRGHHSIIWERKKKRQGWSRTANSYVAASFSCKIQVLPTSHDTPVLRALSVLTTLLHTTQEAITNLLELVLWRKFIHHHVSGLKHKASKGYHKRALCNLCGEVLGNPGG